MSDIFEDLKDKVGCHYVSDLKSKLYSRRARRIFESMDLSHYTSEQIKEMDHYLPLEETREQ